MVGRRPRPVTDEGLTIENIRGMYGRAVDFLRHNQAGEGTEKYSELLATLDRPTYLAALAGDMKTHSFPELDIEPNASGQSYPVYEGKLPLYGAALVCLLAPDLIQRLEEIDNGIIHVSEAATLMEEYAVIYLSFFTFGLPKAEQAKHSKRQSKAASRKKGAEGALRATIRKLTSDSLMDAQEAEDIANDIRAAMAQVEQLERERERDGYKDKDSSDKKCRRITEILKRKRSDILQHYFDPDDVAREILSAANSDSAQRKPGTTGNLKSAIVKLTARGATLAALLETFEDELKINDLYESLSDDDRIDIHTIEVFRDEKFITYTDRKGRTKTATFKTLKEHIYSINK